jgi:hypothetical protein
VDALAQVRCQAGIGGGSGDELFDGFHGAPLENGTLIGGRNNIFRCLPPVNIDRVMSQKSRFQ